MELIEKFVEMYNQYTLSLDKNCDESEFIKKIKPINKRFNEIEKLYDSFSIPSNCSFYEFSLLERVRISDKNETYFADYSDYDMLYIYNKKSKLIYLLDEYSKEIWYCSNNLENFFNSMIIVIDARIKETELSHKNRRDSFFTEKLLECLKINGEKYDYYPFYSHILAIDLHNPPLT